MWGQAGDLEGVRDESATESSSDAIGLSLPKGPPPGATWHGRTRRWR